jgi:hypothetical protein
MAALDFSSIVPEYKDIWEKRLWEDLWGRQLRYPHFHRHLDQTFGEILAIVERQARTGRVYFMHDPAAKLVKIGFTNDLHRRFGGVQSASGRPLVLLGAVRGEMADEKRWHRNFKRLRERGEWFRATSALLRDISAILASDVTPGIHIPRKYRGDSGGGK